MEEFIRTRRGICGFFFTLPLLLQQLQGTMSANADTPIVEGTIVLEEDRASSLRASFLVLKLKELADLHSTGQLSAEEFEAAKAQVLGLAPRPALAPTPASIQREAEIEVARRPRPAARPPRPLSRPRRPPATEHVDRPWAEAHAQAVKASVCRCCASSDGAYIYYCVPTKHHYVLPLCLHLVLCPQQRCDPQCEEASFCAHFGANCPLCPHYGWLAWQSDDNWRTDGEPMMCWCARAQPLAVAIVHLRLPALAGLSTASRARPLGCLHAQGMSRLRQPRQRGVPLP